MGQGRPESVGRSALCSASHDSQTHQRLSQFQSESIPELAGKCWILTSVIFTLFRPYSFPSFPQSRHSAGEQ
jgi:hypothetical protein